MQGASEPNETLIPFLSNVPMIEGCGTLLSKDPLKISVRFLSPAYESAYKKGPAIKIHPFRRSIFLGQKISNIAYPACNLDEISENIVRAVDRYYITYIYFH